MRKIALPLISIHDRAGMSVQLHIFLLKKDFKISVMALPTAGVLVPAPRAKPMIGAVPLRVGFKNLFQTALVPRKIISSLFLIHPPTF